jgi:hypothetical protein
MQYKVKNNFYDRKAIINSLVPVSVSCNFKLLNYEFNVNNPIINIHYCINNIQIFKETLVYYNNNSSQVKDKNRDLLISLVFKNDKFCLFEKNTNFNYDKPSPINKQNKVPFSYKLSYFIYINCKKEDYLKKIKIILALCCFTPKDIIKKHFSIDNGMEPKLHNDFNRIFKFPLSENYTYEKIDLFIKDYITKG